MYARRVEGRDYTFGVSGKLARNALVMYDHQTSSLWTQITGEAIDGPLKGVRLTPVPSGRLSWSIWKRRFPDGLVLSKSRSPRGAYEVDPYSGYYSSARVGLFGPGSVDQRLEEKQYVLGIALAGRARAYPHSLLERKRVVNDVVAGTPVLVVFSGADQSAFVFERYVATSVELTFRLAPGSDPDELRLEDEQSGGLWDGRSGEALAGPWRGWSLNRLPSTSAFWFAWHAHYPDTDVYQET